MPLTLRHVSFGLLFLLSISTLQAKESDYKQPVSIDSGSQQAEMNENKATFLQDVVITQGSIIIHADKVVVLRHTKGDDEMIATGNPATFFQILDNGKPVQASAKQLHYKLKEKLVVLSDKAKLQQQDNEVSGDVIRYDIQKQQMAAESTAKGSRVKTVFLPEQLQEQTSQKDGQ